MQQRRLVVPALAVVVVGLVAGGVGVALVELLHAVQHLAYGYRGDAAFLRGVEAAPPWRRVAAMAVGGAVVGVLWWALRRWGPTLVPATDVVAGTASRPSPVLATAADAVLQVVAVAVGASLGREGAPRQAAAAVADRLAGWARLPAAGRGQLVACAAGAGLAAVYQVPFAGAVFTLEVVLASTALGDVVAALASSAVAAGAAELALGSHPVFAAPPSAPSPWRLAAGAVLVGLLAAPVGAAFRGAASWGRARVPRGGRLPLAVVAVFTGLGLLGGPLPQVLGNGRSLAQLLLTGHLGTGLLLALLLAKPAATALCLRSGARGGMITPSLATGALLGALVAHLLEVAGAAPAAGQEALLGAVAVLAVTQRAPLTALVLGLELTGSPAGQLAPALVAVAVALAAARAVQAAGSRLRRGRPARRTGALGG